MPKEVSQEPRPSTSYKQLMSRLDESQQGPAAVPHVETIEQLKLSHLNTLDLSRG